MVRDIAGQGCLTTRKPPVLAGTELPSPSTMSAMMPGKGRVAEPGLVATRPGKGVIIIAPVSVCHQVSTMGQCSCPMTVLYQIQASGLMGSPTVPNSRSEERSCLLGYSSPQRMKVRMEVGAVYMMVTDRKSVVEGKSVDRGGRR